ncbi:YigZ family protein [Hominiventricola filiformis]|uniref:YigZ family protein n=1 Tax=Hominiventricola filiformis TaxID=2885352 RepID=A0AAE3ABU9_9FIRM|nr:YigZ family protein [Hominiventricola filiformis]MCC2127555.1 YigZ family protein [Hominiventricola filiformis]
MTEQYKTVYEGGEGELVEKKSRFIATVRPVKTEEEANQFVEEMRKKYWDARHNCWAFILGERQEFKRCSDDGEPSQTAGKPMMDVLTGAGLTDVAVVVTRYFGGTLLGTGGLVRAYSGAVQEGLKNSTVITKYLGVKLSVTTDYNGVGKLQYLFGQKEIPILSAEYTDKVVFTVLVESSRIQEIKKAITEATSATAQMEESDPVYFAEINGEFTVM